MSSKSGSMLPGIAAIAAFASGGSVKDIKLASEVSGSAFEHNSLLHLVQDGTFLHDEENREGPSPYDKVKKTSEMTADGVGKAGTWAKENPADAMSVAVDLTMLAINGPAAVSNFMAQRAVKQSVKVGAKVAASGVSKVKVPVATNAGKAVNTPKRAPEFSGGSLSETEFLNSAEKFLGKEYKSLPNGRYVSKDGMRQVRYGRHETQSKKHHGHFEAYDKPNGKIIENTQVEIKPDKIK